MLNVPRLHLDLIDIAETSRDSWHKFQEELSQIANGGGVPSEAFNDSCRKLCAAAKDGKRDVVRAINRPVDIRACTYLWLESEPFLKAHGIDSVTLQRFREVKSRIGYLPRYNLIQLYFKEYEKCGDLDALIEFLHCELEKYEKEELTDDPLYKLSRHRNIVINKQGFKKVADIANTQNRALGDVIQEMGIDVAYEGRFTQLTHGYHYLTQLKELAPNDDSSLLSEVTQTSVTEMAYEEKRLGHHIIEALGKNALNREIELPENWLQSILAIAGDPRIPRISNQYQKWWARINPEVITLVNEKLSGFDLKLFLEVLDDIAKKSNNADLRRMFPKRRLFLEGLLKQKLIRSTRLFISNDADEYLKQHYEQDYLPDYATVSDKNTSIIYLKLDKAHIVEGSHNFKFWLYEDMLENTPPNNYEKSRFSRQSLSNIETESDSWFIVHHGFWQAEIITRLYIMGIKVDPESVLDDDDYRLFRRKLWNKAINVSAEKNIVNH